MHYIIESFIIIIILGILVGTGMMLCCMADDGMMYDASMADDGMMYNASMADDGEVDQ